MHLIYLDDGGKDTIKVFGGVVVDHSSFRPLEVLTAFIVRDLVPIERRSDFTEFHASDLHLGRGSFVGIDEDKRHRALRELVQLRNHLGITYVYSAVDTKELDKSPLRSASWMDTAFFMCACAIDEFIRAEEFKVVTRAMKVQLEVFPRYALQGPMLSLMIIDEPEQKCDKGRIRQSFRSIRQPLVQAMQPTDTTGRSFQFTNCLVAPIDSLFFGSSADSIGLQLADACNWVIWKHLCGEDPGGYYGDLVKGRIVCAKPEPEWTQYRHLFRTHESKE